MDPVSHYRADTDGLQGITMLAVVLFHAHPAALPCGYLGVNVFFVLTDYLQARHLALSVVDAERVCCDFNCTGLRDSRVFYTDDNHLGVARAERVAPLVFESMELVSEPYLAVAAGGPAVGK